MTYRARKYLKLKNIKENGHRVKTAYSLEHSPVLIVVCHHKGRNCPVYGMQCEICRKYNHFTSVSREKRKKDKTNR